MDFNIKPEKQMLPPMAPMMSNYPSANIAPIGDEYSSYPAPAPRVQQFTPPSIPKLKTFGPSVTMVAIPEPEMPLQTVAHHNTNDLDSPPPTQEAAVGFIPMYLTRLAPMATSHPLLVPKTELKESDQLFITITPEKSRKPQGFVNTQRVKPQFPKMDSESFQSHQNDAYTNRPDGKIGKDGRRRLIWTSELHQRFVTSVRVLGIKSSVPKNVLQLMNVEGITRENVASRLQKFRIFVRRMSGISDETHLEDSHLSADIAEAALNSRKLNG